MLEIKSQTRFKCISKSVLTLHHSRPSVLVSRDFVFAFFIAYFLIRHHPLFFCPLSCISKLVSNPLPSSHSCHVCHSYHQTRWCMLFSPLTYRFHFPWVWLAIVWPWLGGESVDTRQLNQINRSICLIPFLVRYVSLIHVCEYACVCLNAPARCFIRTLQPCKFSSTERGAIPHRRKEIQFGAHASHAAGKRLPRGFGHGETDDGWWDRWWIYRWIDWWMVWLMSWLMS